jgi:hypothetical protein
MHPALLVLEQEQIADNLGVTLQSRMVWLLALSGPAELLWHDISLGW